MRRRTCCGILARHIWSKTVRTCVLYRRSLATPTFRPRRYTRIWRWIGCGRCIRNVIRGRRQDEQFVDFRLLIENPKPREFASAFQSTIKNQQMKKASTIIEKAVADFLSHLRERHASPHT